MTKSPKYLLIKTLQFRTLLLNLYCQLKTNKIMKKVKEIRGLKCPNHEYVRDNHHFLYEEAYPGARPLSSTRCIKCGYTMSLHKPQK